eukprot:TRINITY_DN16982_c0_g1_i4.p1 TRINITY_DN16982_c0_g1~~TRINITY_DN16982_c0_g1_i4.p1  ORF type:complete len:209 (-),score=-23.87 TRINITY_DN16982_c0_g1_i4:730-1356(-)
MQRKKWQQYNLFRNQQFAKMDTNQLVFNILLQLQHLQINLPLMQSIKYIPNHKIKFIENPYKIKSSLFNKWLLSDAMLKKNSPLNKLQLNLKKQLQFQNTFTLKSIQFAIKILTASNKYISILEQIQNYIQLHLAIIILYQLFSKYQNYAQLSKNIKSVQTSYTKQTILQKLYIFVNSLKIIQLTIIVVNFQSGYVKKFQLVNGFFKI